MEKKFVLKKNTRLLLLLAAIVILAVAGYGLSISIIPEVNSESYEVYSYSISAGSSYEVALLDNELYEERVLGEGRLYPSNLLDKINVTFTADYGGSKSAAVSGVYSIDVVVRAYQLSSEARLIAYERVFPIVESKTLRGETGLQISDTTAIDLSIYRGFADRAEQILNSKPSREAVVIFSGSFTAQSEYGEIDEPFSYSLQLPLTNDLFSITKAEPFTLEDSLTETREVEQTSGPADFAVPGAAALLALAAIVMLSFFTRYPRGEEQYTAAFISIQRKHGNRLARLGSPPVIGGTRLEIVDFDSMLKIADERRQSIYYCPGADGLPAEGLFYVIDGDKYYVFNLKSQYHFSAI